MIPLRIDPSSVSEVVRASAILLIRLLQVHPGAWADEGPNSGVRQVELRVVIEQRLKGAVRQKPGEEFSLRVQQRRARVTMDYLGLWSRDGVQPGARFLAFCRGQSQDAAQLLTEEHCEQLLEPTQALPDTASALRIEEQDPPIAEVLNEAFTARGSRHAIFARYVWDRVAPEALRSPAAFDRLARIIADPATSEDAREAYLAAAYEKISEARPHALAQRMRLIRALFEVLALPHAPHANIQGVLLRNLIELDKPGGALTADEVFGGSAKEREQAQATVRARPPSPARDSLLQWLSVRARPDRAP
jgi:hypothetical protein